MGMPMIIDIGTEIAIFYFVEFDVRTAPDAKVLVVAGVARMRVILMSAIIAILAPAPLVLCLGTGSGMR